MFSFGPDHMCLCSKYIKTKIKTPSAPESSGVFNFAYEGELLGATSDRVSYAGDVCAVDPPGNHFQTFERQENVRFKHVLLLDIDLISLESLQENFQEIEGDKDTTLTGLCLHYTSRVVLFGGWHRPAPGFKFVKFFF